MLRLRSPALVLAGSIAAAMLVMANVAVLNVALPELSVELGATQAQGQWMVDIYSVVLASLLLPAGAVGDRYGRRLILLAGLFVLVGANAVTVGLDTPNQVIVARAVSGVGAALVFPATLSTITATLPDELRARGIAMWTAAVSAGGFIGILGAGVLIENFRWGSIFVSMAVGAAAVLALCALVVPDSSDPSEASIDPIGGLLSMVAFGGLVLGIIEGPVEGWTSTLALSGLVAGSAALVAFVVWESRVARPLLDVRLFAQKGVRAGSLSIFVQFVGAFGLFFVVVFYLSVVRGYSALQVGLSLVPISVTLLPASAVALPLARRFGRRLVGSTGIVLMAAGFMYGATISVDSGLAPLMIALFVFGAGFGLAGPPATEAIVESLPASKQGVASALNDVLRELGAAIGIAVAGSAFNSAYRSGIGELDGLPAEVIEAVRESPFAFQAVAGGLDPDTAGVLLSGVQQSVVDGWGTAMWVLAITLIVGTIGFATWAPGPARQHAGEQAARAPSDLGRLGAIEMAATAEGQLADIDMLGAEIATALDVMLTRSAAPDDMTSWPAREQVEVAARAVISLERPMADLRGLVARLGDEVVEADPFVTGAQAELARLGREPGELAELTRLVELVRVRFEQLDDRVGQLDLVFGDLAELLSTLRPVATEIASLRAGIDQASRISALWRAPTAPAAASIDLRLQRDLHNPDLRH